MKHQNPIHEKDFQDQLLYSKLNTNGKYREMLKTFCDGIRWCWERDRLYANSECEMSVYISNFMRERIDIGRTRGEHLYLVLISTINTFYQCRRCPSLGLSLSGIQSFIEVADEDNKLFEKYLNQVLEYQYAKIAMGIINLRGNKFIDELLYDAFKLFYLDVEEALLEAFESFEEEGEWEQKCQVC